MLMQEDRCTWTTSGISPSYSLPSASATLEPLGDDHERSQRFLQWVLAALRVLRALGETHSYETFTSESFPAQLGFQADEDEPLGNQKRIPDNVSPWDQAR